MLWYVEKTEILNPQMGALDCSKDLKEKIDGIFKFWSVPIFNQNIPFWEFCTEDKHLQVCEEKWTCLTCSCVRIRTI